MAPNKKVVKKISPYEKYFSKDKKDNVILLTQIGTNINTRTFATYKSIDESMKGVCSIYEEHLKTVFTNQATITYDLAQLLRFIDELHLLCCMIYQESVNRYTMPLNKDWIKKQMFEFLLKESRNAE